MQVTLDDVLRIFNILTSFKALHVAYSLEPARGSML